MHAMSICDDVAMTWMTRHRLLQRPAMFFDDHQIKSTNCTKFRQLYKKNITNLISRPGLGHGRHESAHKAIFLQSPLHMYTTF